MGDNLLESYNPLYDVHLRQYFALPHMQKHLRNLGLLDGSSGGTEELHAGHLQMMDMMLRNRERVLQQLVDLQRKLDAAEKVELYRRIRSGVTNAEELERSHVSRSLSRPARSALGNGRFSREGENIRRRQQSHSPEAGDLIKRVETDYRADSAPIKNSKSIYNRLAANAYKYQYLHKLDDRTLRKYMNSLRKQLAKLERFREVSFGPHTMAKHQPAQLQQSWFFRRRSLPSLDAAVGATNNSQTQQANGGGWRSLKSGRKSRSGKSQSPRRATTGTTGDEPVAKIRRTSMSRTRASQKLPPLPQSAKRSFTGNRSMPTPGKSMEHKLPPTSVVKQPKKTQERPTRRPQPATVHKTPGIKPTPPAARPPSQKGSITPVKVKKPPSLSGALPVIGTAVGAAAVGAGIAAMAGSTGNDEERKEEDNRENVAPSPSISLAASQTTTTDGGQPAGDSEWEGDQIEAPAEIQNEEKTRQTPGPFEEENKITQDQIEEPDEPLTARNEVQSSAEEKLLNGIEDKGMEDKENEEKMEEAEVAESQVQAVQREEEEENASRMEEDEVKNIEEEENKVEEEKEIPLACNLQEVRAKREAALRAEQEQAQRLEEENQMEEGKEEEKVEKYEDKENEVTSPKSEEIIQQESPEILENGSQIYLNNEENEGSERSVEIKGESLKDEASLHDEKDKRESDSRVSFENDRQKCEEEGVVEMEEVVNQQEEEEEKNEEKEESLAKSPVKVMITPSPENRRWSEEEESNEVKEAEEEANEEIEEAKFQKEEHEEENEDKIQKEEHEGVQHVESPIEDNTSISHHSEGFRDNEVENEESLRLEEEKEHYEQTFESPHAAINGQHFNEEIEDLNKSNELNEAERVLEHRYELPETTTIAGYIEDTSEYLNKIKKDEEGFEEQGGRMKRDIEGFGREEEKEENGNEEEYVGMEDKHTGREEPSGRVEEGFERKEEKDDLKDIEGFGRESGLTNEEKNEEYNERQSEIHTGREEEEHFRREKEEHFGRDEEQNIGREEEEGHFGMEEQHTGREDFQNEEEENRGGEELNTGRTSFEQIQPPDETQFDEQLVESESVLPTNENSSRKLSGSDKFINYGEGERPETMMSITENTTVLPDEEFIQRNESELENYSKKEEEINDENLVLSEGYERPESSPEHSEALTESELKHVDEHQDDQQGQETFRSEHEVVSEHGNEAILEHEPGVEHEEIQDAQAVQEDRPEIQQEILEQDHHDETDLISQPIEDFPEAGNENVISEASPREVQQVISESRNEDLIEERPFEEEKINENESLIQFTPREASVHSEGLTEDEQKHVDKHPEYQQGQETFRSEHSEDQNQSVSPTLSASIYDVDARSIGTTHSKPFLQQPSIEITPASDHFEENRGDDSNSDKKSINSQPMTPLGEENENDQQHQVDWRHNYEQQDIHQNEPLINTNNDNNNYQEQLIDFSSSPTFAQGEDNLIDNRDNIQQKEEAYSSPHQNGHKINYEKEEKEEEENEEDDENTSLLTYRDENNENSFKNFKPIEHTNGEKNSENGHLLMGNGGGGGRKLSSSSTETEGADNDNENNQNSDSSSVVIRQGTSSTHLENFQQI